MKVIGLIGGMSWESTVTYYRIINEKVKNMLGGLHSAKCILYSVDFHEIEECQATGNWEKSGEILGNAAQSLEKSGADFIVICTNTMHKVVNIIKKKISIPIFHIAEATADEILKKGIKNIGLLGTKYTMEQEFYKSVLTEKGINVIIPDKDDMEIINKIIYDELCVGIINSNSRLKYTEIANKLKNKGIEGIILGCTEIGLLIGQENIDIPLFDTALIHAKKAAEFSINGNI
ncbi:aspartate/glutamate racemase family protein [Leptotrichia sp. OH3620_COT-345]|uniref:aspartate/glutamate racemase family protein n=1 Tax=Leptotrichia sp. OH3620_COT-345 TaxID=2491048 RepID=UPI000F651E2D|nr:aspartate/glutamate racemase family protein [Leptotrichia sp. OH3620_COT-345]RRD39543.1 aspartate/glutamate racemase family protein [Leptotrichia sp. OH3620_COT-345]